ncbi:hypothetical protein B0E43_11260 [Algoriphagus sp. A40]|nr:hypothetical protein B0E43_11260 [Algoriphagus sp. A40]
MLVAGLYLVTLLHLITTYGALDIKDHNQLLREYLAAGSFPIPPGYYFLIFLVDLVVRVKYTFVASSAIVLTVFQWWKFKLVYSSIERQGFGLEPRFLFPMAFSFLFLSPIYLPMIDGEFWYLGKFTQTIWHNSTLICVFPFCILLVWKTFDWFRSGKLKDLGGMFLLGFVIVLIKPSFLFCYIPALPIFIFIRDRGFSKELFQAIGLVLVLFVALLVEKHLIFTWDPVLDSLYTPQEKSQVVINPLRVWLKFSHEPVFDFLSSFPLIIAFLILWRKRAFESTLFAFSLLLLFFALVVYLLLAETGFREFHGNFYWQIPIALFLCHLAIVHTVLGQFLNGEKKMQAKYYAILSIYLIQVALGICYWLRIFTGFTLS